MQKVSIIIPVYATQEQDITFLIQAIESAIKQGEVVVVDDDSPYEVNPDRLPAGVKFASVEHGGKGAARNLAVSGATYSLVYPLDADDWLEEGAIDYLFSQWSGVPLYTNLKKVYTTNDRAADCHQLPNFSCELLATTCISSVNVLHTKAQHKAVGGWPLDMDLYEDWWYNANLFWRFGAKKVGQIIKGVNIRQPLVNYRQHTGQSIVRLKNTELVTRQKLLEKLARLEETTGMACCGKRRTKSNQIISSVAARTATTSSRTRPMTPLANGGESVKALFLDGKGQGKHGYRGVSTRHLYYGKHGEIINADKRDTIDRATYNSGRARCRLVRVEAAAAPPSPEPIASTNFVPSTTLIAVPTPPSAASNNILAALLEQRKAELANMTVRDIVAAAKGWSSEVKAQYLAAERAGKNRVSAKTVLRK